MVAKKNIISNQIGRFLCSYKKKESNKTNEVVIIEDTNKIARVKSRVQNKMLFFAFFGMLLIGRRLVYELTTVGNCDCDTLNHNWKIVISKAICWFVCIPNRHTFLYYEVLFMCLRFLDDCDCHFYTLSLKCQIEWNNNQMNWTVSALTKTHGTTRYTTIHPSIHAYIHA